MSYKKSKQTITESGVEPIPSKYSQILIIYKYNQNVQKAQKLNTLLTM